MPLPPGYFLTWHTYGTWLHGDAAGSVDAQHNTYATPRLPADRDRFSIARAKMSHPPFVLSIIAPSPEVGRRGEA